jgi:hypothetical protein
MERLILRWPNGYSEACLVVDQQPNRLSILASRPSHRPKRLVICDGSLEPDPSLDEGLRQIEHSLKRTHLLRIGSRVPSADVRHRIIFAVNPHVVGSVSLQRADRWDKVSWL